MGKGGRQIVRAAALVMVFFVVSRVLGLMRQMVMGAQFGTGGDLDAYLAAARIPELIFLVITGGALGSAFIPIFADHLARDDQAGAWRLASAVINLALIILTAITILTALLALPLVETVIGPGFSAEQQQLTASLLRLMLISTVIFGVSGIVMGILNAHQHFFLPALAPSLYNLAIIGGAVFLGPGMGVRGMAVGVVVGATLHLLIQIPGLLRHGVRYRPVLGLDDPSVRQVGRLVAPRMLGTAVTQLNFVINNSLASSMGAGAVSAINFAWLLMLLPQGVFAQAVGTAAFPTFAAQVARGERKEMGATLMTTLRAVFFLSMPATMGLLVLGRPLVGLLFERGAFEASSTDAVVWALGFYALGLVGHAGLEIIARAFYALHDTLTPVWVGGVAMGLNVLLSLTLPLAFALWDWPSYGGLALANSLATLLELVLLMILIRRCVGGFDGRRMLTAFARSGSATLAMGIVLLVWQAVLPDASTLVVGGGGIILGAAVYGLVALLLGAEELGLVLDLVRRR